MLNRVLLILVAVLAVPRLIDLFEPSPPSICLVNLANNPRTASLFSRGMLEKHGSKNTFEVVSPTKGCHPSSTRIQLVHNRQLMEWCLGDEVCIVTGDEECRAPAADLGSLHSFLIRSHLYSVLPEKAALGYQRGDLQHSVEDTDDDFDEVFDEYAEHFAIVDKITDPDERSRLQRLHLEIGLQQLRPNIILREFYSSKFNYPAVALGARYEFLPVSDAERDAGNRKYIFNFMGSIKVGKELDREHLRDVINANHWEKPTHFVMFDQLVRNPNSSTVEEYRNTLLASSFTLAPVGTADDCFRFWEAIEAGSIPIYVRRMGNVAKKSNCPDAFEDVLATNPPIVLLKDWDELPSFAKKVTEAEIDAMRRKLVTWANQWWTNTSRAVDAAIETALRSRDDALALSDDEMKMRIAEVSTALSAVKEQQNRAADATKAEKARQQAARQRKAQQRRDEKAKERAKRDADKAEKVKEASQTKQKSPVVPSGASSEQLARLQEASANIGDGKLKITKSIVSSLISYPEMDETILKRPSFEWVHLVVLNILKKANYLPNLLSADEYDCSSAYMQYPINRASFIIKIVKEVARDLNIPPVFVNPQYVLERKQPDRTRLFLCFLTRAAETHAAGTDTKSVEQRLLVDHESTAPPHLRSTH